MPIIKLPGGSLRDEIREPIYDTIDLTGNVTGGTFQFFRNIQGKSLAQTNLRREGALETANSFRLQGLAVDVQNFVDANIAAVPTIFEESSLELRIGEKVYWQGPMRFIAGRLWTDIAGTGDTTNNAYQQHGFSAVAPVILHGKHSIDINPLQTFDLKWVIDTINVTIANNTKLRYVGSLKGLRRRPVQ